MARWILASCVQRPWWTVTGAIAILLIGAVSAFQLKPDTSLAALVSPDSRSAWALAHIASEFQIADELLIVVGPHRGSQTELLLFAERLKREVEAVLALRAKFESLRWKIDPDAPERAFVQNVMIPNMLLYVEDDAFDEAMERLTFDSMKEQIARNEALIAAPGGAADALARCLLRDPLRLRELFADASQFGPTSVIADERDHAGIFYSADGQRLLIRAAGIQPPGDLAFTRAFVNEMRNATIRANSADLPVALSGSYAIAATSERAIRADMIRSVIGSVLMIQILFLLLYRRIWSFLLAFAPVAIALIAAFGLYSFLGLSLTPVAAVIGAVLAGLGIDYCIHLIAAYQDEGQVGAAPKRTGAQQTLRAATSVAPRISAAALTTLIGFLALAQSDVRSVRDFAVLGAMGLALSLVAALLLLPAILTIIGNSRWRIEPGWIDSIMRRIVARLQSGAGVVIGMTSVLWVVAGMVIVCSAGPVVLFENDLRSMHPVPNPALDLQESIAEEFPGMGGTDMLLHVSEETPRKLLRRVHELASRMMDLQVDETRVESVQGLHRLLPPPDRTDARRAVIEAVDVDRVAADFALALEDSIFDVQAFHDYESFLRTLLSPVTDIDIDILRSHPEVAKAVLPRSGVDAVPPETVALISLSHSVDDRVMRRRMINVIRAAVADLEGVTLTGMSVVGHDVETQIRSDLTRLLGGAAAAIILFLLLVYRNVIDVALICLPVAFALTMLFGAMHIFGQGLNMVNLIAIPLLCGIGVDDGIVLVAIARTARREQTNLPGSDRDVRMQFRSTVHAIIVTSLTTMLGFGSLVFTSTPAIQSLGWMSVVGVGSCLIAALGILFPLLARMEHQRAMGANI